MSDPLHDIADATEPTILEWVLLAPVIGLFTMIERLGIAGRPSERGGAPDLPQWNAPKSAKGRPYRRRTRWLAPILAGKVSPLYGRPKGLYHYRVRVCDI
jgi:hypothetical protein